jgi:hypothetical protein
MDRLFTREEAEQLLPTLIPKLERLRGIHRELALRHEELVALHRRARGNGRDLPSDELESKQREADDLEAGLRREVQTILDQGVEVKDLEMGLLDFPSLLEGRVVYLCWKLGEAGIGYWHELDDGYPGRQPL